MSERVQVLLIEDAEDVRTLIIHLLDDDGYDLSVAGDGDAGLHAAETVRPDLILLDMSLPLTSGWEVVRRLRADGYAGPVVALTAHAMRGDHERALELGCTDYLSKPFEIDDLLAMVERYTNR